MVERHNILEPADLMLAQYSIPFSVALALCREARDPEILGRGRRSPTRRSARSAAASGAGCRGGEHGGMASTVTVMLADGRRFERRAESGMLEEGEFADKFLRLTRGRSASAAQRRSTSACSVWRTKRASTGSARRARHDKPHRAERWGLPMVAFSGPSRRSRGYPPTTDPRAACSR